jgi:hypothetical protein
MVFTEVAIDGSWGSEGRLDVVTAMIGSRYSGCTVTGYECKANRADWLRDHAADKWSRYLPMLDALYLAVPAGANVLKTVHEAPAPLGVVTLDPHDRLRVIRKPGKLAPPDDRCGVWWRLLRRQDDMLTDALQPRESRLDRMRRLEEIREDMRLAATLSRRFQDAESELRWRTRHIETEVRNLEQRRDTLRAELAQMGDVPGLLDTVTRLIGMLQQATRPLYNDAHSKQARDKVRDDLTRIAAVLEEADR